jgi:hypothetical protein
MFGGFVFIKNLLHLFPLLATEPNGITPQSVALNVQSAPLAHNTALGAFCCLYQASAFTVTPILYNAPSVNLEGE